MPNLPRSMFSVKMSVENLSFSFSYLIHWITASALQSLIIRPALMMNSSGFSLNRWKVVGLMPFRISTIDLRVNPVAVTSLPIRSYVTPLPTASVTWIVRVFPWVMATPASNDSLSRMLSSEPPSTTIRISVTFRLSSSALTAFFTRSVVSKFTW